MEAMKSSPDTPDITTINHKRKLQLHPNSTLNDEVGDMGNQIVYEPLSDMTSEQRETLK